MGNAMTWGHPGQESLREQRGQLDDASESKHGSSTTTAIFRARENSRIEAHRRRANRDGAFRLHFFGQLADQKRRFAHPQASVHRKLFHSRTELIWQGLSLRWGRLGLSLSRTSLVFSSKYITSPLAIPNKALTT